MAILLLARHAATPDTGRTLIGWTPGLGLDEPGRAAAAELADRLRPLALSAIVSSPLERCLETAAAVALGRSGTVTTDERLGETRYGTWTGRDLRSLRREPLWRTLMSEPSAVTFPGGESLLEVQSRAVAAVRDWVSRLGREATLLVCSHADVIATILADALGAHLDRIHRLRIDPCSISVIRYGPSRPLVVRVNDTGRPIGELFDRRTRRPMPRSAASG